MAVFSRAHSLLPFALGALAAPALGQWRPEYHPIPGFPEVELRPLPAIDLLAFDGPSPPIRDIQDFCLLDEHCLAILRSDQTLLVITDHGELLSEIPLPRCRFPIGPFRPQIERFDLLVRMGPNRVILAPDRNWSDDMLRPTALLEVDLTTGAMRIPAFLPLTDDRIAIAGGPEGELALLIHPDSTSTKLFVLDAGGSLDWSREKRLCAGYELGFTRDGRIAILDPGNNAVQLVRWRGWWSTYTRLGLDSGEQSRSTGLQCTQAGEFLFSCYTRSGFTVIRTDEDFNLREAVVPHHSEGTPIDRKVRASPAGRIWASDWYSISRIGPDGLAEITLGIGPEAHRLEGARRVAIDREDRIFAVAERDDAVHEFDRTGKRVRITPRPSGTAPLRSRDDVPKGFEAVFGPWFPHQTGDRIWDRDWNELRLLDSSGATLFEAALGDSRELAGPSADGAVALLRPGKEGAPGEAVLLDREAKEKARWPMPELPGYFESADLDARCVVVVLPDRVLAWRADGSPWFTASIPYSCSHMGCGMVASVCWDVHLTRDGREIWLTRGPEATTIERYALP